MSQLAGDRGFDISSDQILARTGGVIANSNTELLFGGVSLRSFEFQWLLTPRDDQENPQHKNDYSCVQAMVCSKKNFKISLW